MIAECEALLEKECGGKVFLVPSCTAALEAACLLTLSQGDEVIMPSWAHPADANSVIRAGAIPVFVDVDKNLNIDVTKIKKAITAKTKAILPVHYGGVVADDVTEAANEYGLYVIEDAAQAIGNWKVKGDFGCLSFNYTKSVQCGEGGALVVNNPAFIERAEVLLNFGTTKAKFRRGEAASWQWLDIGSSYVISSYAAEHLHKELLDLKTITERRKSVWQTYEYCVGTYRPAGNGHIFWYGVEDRASYFAMAAKRGISITSHFDALHMTVPGRKYGRVGGPIERATWAMRHLVKLNTGVTEQEAIRICSTLFPERVLAA